MTWMWGKSTAVFSYLGDSNLTLRRMEIHRFLGIQISQYFCEAPNTPNSNKSDFARVQWKPWPKTHGHASWNLWEVEKHGSLFRHHPNLEIVILGGGGVTLCEYNFGYIFVLGGVPRKMGYTGSPTPVCTCLYNFGCDVFIRQSFPLADCFLQPIK